MTSNVCWPSFSHIIYLRLGCGKYSHSVSNVLNSGLDKSVWSERVNRLTCDQKMLFTATYTLFRDVQCYNYSRKTFCSGNATHLSYERYLSYDRHVPLTQMPWVKVHIFAYHRWVADWARPDIDCEIGCFPGLNVHAIHSMSRHTGKLCALQRYGVTWNSGSFLLSFVLQYVDGQQSCQHRTTTTYSGSRHHQTTIIIHY